MIKKPERMDLKGPHESNAWGIQRKYNECWDKWQAYHNQYREAVERVVEEMR